MTTQSKVNEPCYWAIVPAAGAGRRMSTDIPKQYLMLGDKTVLEHSLDTLFSCERLAGVVLVLAADDGYWPDLQTRYKDQVLETVIGGSERCHSVFNALNHLAGKVDEHDWALVHDAARPCVHRDDIDLLIQTLAVSQGGLLGVPVADTMKHVDDELCITATAEREGLWHALTPQMFRIGLLRGALREAIAQNRPVTDEASAMELAGYQPRMVQGRPGNIKITVPADLALATFYLQSGKLS